MICPTECVQKTFEGCENVFITHDFTHVPKLRNLTSCLFYVAKRKCAKFSSPFPPAY